MKTFFFIILSFNFFNVLASDSILIHIVNLNKVHKIEIHNYKKEKNYYFKTITSCDSMSFKAPYRCYYEIGCIIEFWVYVKNKYFFGGKWMKITTTLKKDKHLILFYSSQRKAKFCYEVMWITKEELEDILDVQTRNNFR
jgi:hypothetical protein